MNGTQFPFSRKNLICLGICSGILLVCVGAGILPLHARHRALDQKIAAVKQQLAVQQAIQTNIIVLDDIIAKLNQQPTPKVVKPIPLSQDQAAKISDDFRAMAHEVALTVDRIDPLLENNTEWNSLTVKAECIGEPDSFRRFLLKLLSLPYVRQIDRITIHPQAPSLRFSLTYTIDLA